MSLPAHLTNVFYCNIETVDKRDSTGRKSRKRIGTVSSRFVLWRKGICRFGRTACFKGLFRKTPDRKRRSFFIRQKKTGTFFPNKHALPRCMPFVWPAKTTRIGDATPLPEADDFVSGIFFGERNGKKAVFSRKTKLKHRRRTD